MQKNIKIKLLFNFKVFMVFFLFISLTTFNNAYCENYQDNTNNESMQILPGEEVITNTNKKMKVWTTKEDKKVITKTENENDNENEILSPKTQVIVIKDDHHKRSGRRRFRK